MNLGRFSVKNPVLINISMIAILLLGIVSFLRLPRELESDVAFSWVFIAIPYPGVSAEEIEKNITIKVEDEISDVDKIKRIRSTTYEGLCFLQVEFEDDISDDEFRRVYQDLRAEFDKVPLPDDALDPQIDDFSSSDFFSIVTIVLNGEVDEMQLNTIANELKEKILDVPGVSKVEPVGARERKIRIEVDKNKIESFGISLDEIEQAIQGRNINVPGGTLRDDSREYILRTIGEIKNINEFGNVIIRNRPGQGSIKISDVAIIKDTLSKAVQDARFNGKKSISLVVSKKLKNNSISVVKGVRKAVDLYKKSLPESITLTYSNDTTWFIRESLSTLGTNAVMGFLLLVIVLFVFIGLRNALLTALGIPLAFSITFLWMDNIGETLNGNSLFALVLVLGMIVDHAIVIIENCYRYRQMGLSRHEAAIKGTNEVILPVIAATGTTVAAFLPLMILPGIMGKFMRIIPIVVSLALVASTIEALLFLPSHFADWSGSVKEKGTGFIGRWQAAFKNLVSRAYHHRYITLVITNILIVATLFMYPLIKQDLFAGENFPFFMVDIQLPVGTPRESTENIAKRFEDRLMPLVGNGEVISLSTTVGFLIGETEWLTQSNVAQITVELEKRQEGRKRPVPVIMRELQEMCNNIPGAEIVNFRVPPNGPPRDKPISFRLQGDNYDDMASLSADYKKILEEYPEVYNIDDNYDMGSPELKINIDEDRTSALGLNAALIGLYIRKCFEGSEATVFYDEDEEIDVIVSLAEKNRRSVEDVLNLSIPTPDGRFIPFSSVCTLEYGKSIGAIRRLEKKREITISADSDLDNRKIKEIMKRIENEFNTKHKRLYPDISLKVGGEFEEFNTLLADVARLFGVGLFLMFVIMGAQFKSYFQPLIMGLTIFFALVGCFLFLLISRTPLSIVVLFAVVALAGIAVNDAIVLISFINGLRRKGMPVKDAVIEGATIRLRPIILTSVTTIGGLIPMAIGLGGYSPTWGPMASTIIFGLFFSTIGTLIVIPCAYGILNDISTKFGFTMKLEGDTN